MKQKIEKERHELLNTIINLVEGPIAFLGFVWLILLVLELVWGLSRPLYITSMVIWIIFIIDFLIKFIIAPKKIAFLKTNWLTAISLIIPAIRIFRIIRLLRMVRGIRLIRVLSSLNRSMKSLAVSMHRRGFAYVALLSVFVVFGGAAGMFALEQGNTGFESYGLSLWWTSMRVITAGSDHWPQTGEGRGLAFVLSLYGYAVFGYVTATLATFFIGRDAEESDAPIAGARELDVVKKMLVDLNEKIDNLDKSNQS